MGKRHLTIAFLSMLAAPILVFGELIMGIVIAFGGSVTGAAAHDGTVLRDRSVEVMLWGLALLVGPILYFVLALILAASR